MIELMFYFMVAIGQPVEETTLTTVITLYNEEGVTVVSAQCVRSPDTGNILFRARAERRNFVIRGVHFWQT